MNDVPTGGASGDATIAMTPIYCDSAWALMPTYEGDNLGNRVRYEEMTLRELRQAIGDRPRYDSEEAALEAMAAGA